MTGSKQNLESDAKKSPRESGEDSEDDSEILEESPCGRWLKRKEEVEQRDVPGIDNAYLAMDTEEGVEVVWNEVLFSERKNFKSQEENIKFVFDNLTQLEHPNIVKFHKYWMDFKDERPRVIFITEYMSSGSLKQFLKRTKRNVKKLPLHFWKRWCTQILSALSYLHSCSPPIIHGNLTCDTIFIQHNGLVKIGSVAPDAIQRHVKTYRDNMKAMHFVAPEYEGGNVTTAADIFSFGMCALETAALEIPGNGDTGVQITEDTITKTLDSLNEKQQQDFIRECLRKDPKERPTARELLFHPVLFEVHSLKLLAAHCLIHHTKQLPEAVDEYTQSHYGEGTVIAEILHPDRPNVQYQLSDAPVTEKLEKFMEDVKFGIYPLTAFALPKPSPPQQTSSEPETKVPLKSDAPDPVDIETRRILNMMCNVKPKSDGHEMFMTILLRLDDKMNRQLSCVVANSDTPPGLATELVNLAFINEADHDKVASLIEDTIKNYRFGLQSGVNSPETIGIKDS